MIDITPIIGVLILGLGAILAAFVIPYIKTKTTNEQRDFLYNWVKTGCEAAEQLAKTGEIQKKDRKEHVLKFLNSKGITYSDADVNEMIESVVCNLHAMLNS